MQYCAILAPQAILPTCLSPRSSYETWRWAIATRSTALNQHLEILGRIPRTTSTHRICPPPRASAPAAIATWGPFRLAAPRTTTLLLWTQTRPHPPPPQFAPIVITLVSTPTLDLVKAIMFSKYLKCLNCPMFYLWEYKIYLIVPGRKTAPQHNSISHIWKRYVFDPG